MFSLDQSLRCLPLKRTREGMIHPLDWCTLTWNAKQQNWPKLLGLRNALPVNVSSAIVIAVGSQTSTSLTGVLSINTGSCFATITSGMPWTFFDALMLSAGAPVPIQDFKLRKARELSPLPFLIQLLTEGNYPLHKHAARNPCARSLMPVTLPATTCHLDTNPWSGLRGLLIARHIDWNLVHCKWSPLKIEPHWSTDHHHVGYLRAVLNQVPATHVDYLLQLLCCIDIILWKHGELPIPHRGPFLLSAKQWRCIICCVVALMASAQGPRHLLLTIHSIDHCFILRVAGHHTVTGLRS